MARTRPQCRAPRLHGCAWAPLVPSRGVHGVSLDAAGGMGRFVPGPGLQLIVRETNHDAARPKRSECSAFHEPTDTTAARRQCLHAGRVAGRAPDAAADYYDNMGVDYQWDSRRKSDKTAQPCLRKHQAVFFWRLDMTAILRMIVYRQLGGDISHKDLFYGPCGGHTRSANRRLDGAEERDQEDVPRRAGRRPDGPPREENARPLARED